MHHQCVTQVEKTGLGSVSVLPKQKTAGFMMQVAEQDDVLNTCLNPLQTLAKSVSNLI